MDIILVKHIDLTRAEEDERWLTAAAPSTAISIDRGAVSVVRRPQSDPAKPRPRAAA